MLEECCAKLGLENIEDVTDKELKKKQRQRHTHKNNTITTDELIKRLLNHYQAKDNKVKI